MKQAIAGVTPSESGEVTITTVWPSIAATGLGRFLGRRFSNRAGIGNIFTIGNLWAALTIPVSLALFFAMLGPGLARRYRLTNRRLIVERGMLPRPERWVSLDDFDAIEVEVLPGQDWFPAGEMIFRKGAVETFRISGVPRAETFRHVCLKAQRAHKAVKDVMAHQPVGAA